MITVVYLFRALSTQHSALSPRTLQAEGTQQRGHGERRDLVFPDHRITRSPDHRITRSLHSCPASLAISAADATCTSAFALPKTCAIRSSRSLRMETVSPTRTMVKSSSMSFLPMRMHPCEAALPMDLGALVPWIP